MTALLRHSIAGFRMLLAITVVVGGGFPLLVWGIGRVAFPDQAAGSMLSNRAGQVVGSSLIGQDFAGQAWLHGRPSAVDNDPTASGGSNLGPNDPTLVASIEAARAKVAKAEDVPADTVPPDAITTSASGLDPDISPAYARLQIPRLARYWGLSPTRVTAIVSANSDGRTLGFLGEPVVNVLAVNTALAAAAPGRVPAP